MVPRVGTQVNHRMEDWENAIYRTGSALTVAKSGDKNGHPISNGASAPNAERPLPPITELATATMILVVTTGIYITALIPQPIILALPIALLELAAAIMVVNVVVLSRLRDFAWDTFFLVGRYQPARKDR